MSSEISIEHAPGGVAWLTIDRAEKHNALASGVLDALARAVNETARDPRTRAVVVRGAGDRYFAAGGDLVELSAVRTDAQVHAMADRATAALDAIRTCELPVVAYLNGDALGGGAELAVACDLRLMAPHARIGFVQARLGISTAWGGGPDLCALVGPARAMRMMARCELVEADVAVAWGLADLEVREGPGGAEVKDFLEPLLGRSRLALRAIKEQCSAWRAGLPMQARRDAERRSVVSTWSSAEHWDAVERFLAREKR